MNWYKKAQEEERRYRGIHQAPTRDGGAPLYDLTEIYPDDIYSVNGVRYYGHGEPFDRETISIIQAAKGNPNYPLTIYRAVPDRNSEVKNQIKELSKILTYHYKFGFFPMNNDIVGKIQEKYPVPDYDYTTQQQKIFSEIKEQIENYKEQMKSDIKIDINVGDWVTVNRAYAKQHGESTLWAGYKIISKKVRAKDIFTDGNSIHEWGYDPQ